MVNNSPQEIWQAITSAKTPLCVIDSRFDFDSFGSCYALKNVLEGKDIPLKLIYEGKIPTYAITDFDPAEIEQEVDLSSYDFSRHDVLITLDCPALYHLSSNRVELNLPPNIKIVNIDHHATNKMFGTLNYFHVQSSTCRLVFDILTANNVDIDKTVGTYLLKGLLTDSGILQYDEVDAGDFDMVAKIIKTGVDYNEMVRELTFNENADTIKFKKFVYNRMVVNEGSRFAYLAYRGTDLVAEDISSDQVMISASDLMRKMSMVDYVFSIRDDARVTNKWWIGFRSRLSNLDVSKYAEALGGGGHKMAAGATIENVETIEEAVDKVLEAVKKVRN